MPREGYELIGKEINWFEEKQAGTICKKSKFVIYGFGNILRTHLI
jgi:hypothetical protein